MPKAASDIATTAKDVVKRNRVSKGVYLQRLNACDDCIYLLKAIDVCRKCGCFVKAKALSPSMTCPLGKWSSDSGEVAVDAAQDDGRPHDTDEVDAD